MTPRSCARYDLIPVAIDGAGIAEAVENMVLEDALPSLLEER
jgi:hypothetical protein